MPLSTPNLGDSAVTAVGDFDEDGVGGSGDRKSVV
jgi:hypothetical protein